MYTFSGENPTTLHKEALEKLYSDGEELSPRGKLIKELRPVSIEFLNPLNRVTFLATRRVNPFFQLAESMQIISGINDAKWLSLFNANMINFSDNGKNYNAFYGERIRRWGDGDAHGVKAVGRDGEGSLDQLYDVYKRILEDKDTRQAMIAIGNPTFDNYKYLNEEKGLDIACLVGDTLVSTPEGPIAIKDIEEGDPVFSYNTDTSEVEIKRVLAKSKTKKNAKLLKVNIGDGSYIKCTPEHIFYVYSIISKKTVHNKNRKGVHQEIKHGLVLKRADELEPGDKLRVLNIVENNGYDVYNKHNLTYRREFGGTVPIYRSYAEYLIDRKLNDDEVVHHLDHNKKNNSKENISVMEKSDHDRLHFDEMYGNTRQAGTSKKKSEND